MDKELCISLASHAIGLDNEKPYKRHGKLFYKPYRNYFSTAKSCDDFEQWKTMEDLGYAESWPMNRDRYMFGLTRKGIDWLGEQLGIKIYDEEM